MVNRLDMAAISHFGIDNDSPLEARRKAGLLFAKALSRGKKASLWRMLRGKGNKLQDLAQISSSAQRKSAKSAGVVNIPISKIVGSEGRVDDFDSAFNPLKSHNRDRWIGIAVARRQGIVLPPVELIQVDDLFFVRDGHHRISVAKAAGQAMIEAQIV